MAYVFLNIYSMLASNQCTKNSLIQVPFILNSPTNDFLFLFVFFLSPRIPFFIQLKSMFISFLQTELKITCSKNPIQLNPSDLITLGFFARNLKNYQNSWLVFLTCPILSMMLSLALCHFLYVCILPN